jgi:hypothetical protein
MSEGGVGPKQFWLGIVAEIVAVVLAFAVTACQTNAQTQLQTLQNRSVMIQGVVRATGEVAAQLESLADMNREIELCLQKPRSTPPTCWSAANKHAFKHSEAERALIELDAIIAGAYPALTGRDRKALDRIAEVRQGYMMRLKPLLGPETPEAAREAFALLMETRRSLLDALRGFRPA